MYEKRFYRDWMKSNDLVSFEVIEKETDLFISADLDLEKEAIVAVSRYRNDIEDYIAKNPEFYASLIPLKVKEPAPMIVKMMIEASEKAKVGPMAAVAGAMAECVGNDLLKLARDVIVENGGDIFIKASKPRIIGIYAGKSALSGKLAITIEPGETPCGVCTSSGTVGHSLSFGKADAAVIVSRSASLADVVATFAGNLVRKETDVEGAIKRIKLIDGVTGVIIIINDKIGTWGSINLSKI